MIHFILFTFQMYSNSLRFQQKEPNNHSNSMNEQKNVEGDQILQLTKFLQHHIFVTVQEWLRDANLTFL